MVDARRRIDIIFTAFFITPNIPESSDSNEAVKNGTKRDAALTKLEIDHKLQLEEEKKYHKQQEIYLI